MTQEVCELFLVYRLGHHEQNRYNGENTKQNREHDIYSLFGIKNKFSDDEPHVGSISIYFLVELRKIKVAMNQTNAWADFVFFIESKKDNFFAERDQINVGRSVTVSTVKLL